MPLACIVVDVCVVLCCLLQICYFGTDSDEMFSVYTPQIPFLQQICIIFTEF